MNCPFCGTTNPDNGAFCVQCGKNLKDAKPLPITPSIESHSSLTEETLPDREDNQLTNSSEHTGDEDTKTSIPAQKRDDEDTPIPSYDSNSLSTSAQTEEPATIVEVQKEEPRNPFSLADESTRLVQPTGNEQESYPIVEEMPTQITPDPAIESEHTLVGSSASLEVTSQQEQAAIEAQHAVVPPDAPTISGTDQPSMAQQEPPVYPGYSEYTNHPDTPSSPYHPNAPVYGSTPSSPYYPGYPVAPDGMYQSAPGYPTYPGYPQGQPGVSGSQYPQVNTYPPQPGSFSNQTGGPATAGYPYPPTMMQQPAKRERDTRIAHPLPRWMLILCIIAVLVILAALQATGSDWADGAIHAAIGAIIIAVLLLVFAGIRTFLGMANATNPKRRSQYIGSALAIMLLFVYSGLNLIGQTPLHSLQAHYVEGQQHWQQAINEYELGGEIAPTSVNIARTYDEWGEELNQSGHYTDALSKFNTTLNNYTTPNEITRAQKGEINSYLQMGKQAAQNNNYTLATKNFDTGLGLAFCHAQCQNQINPVDATAYYNLAQSQLNAQQWNDAVNNFKTVQSRFVNSPEAKKVHTYLATALMGKGKQDKANVCASAIPTYQDLAQNYADTPEGKDATSELSQPQPVTGHFTSPLPTDAVPMVVLTSNPINGNMSDNDLTSAIDNATITAFVNSDGTFKFSAQKQGAYDLAWTNITSTTIYYSFPYIKNDPAKPAYYVANVGPLCPFDFGDISDPIAHQ